MIDAERSSELSWPCSTRPWSAEVEAKPALTTCRHYAGHKLAAPLHGGSWSATFHLLDCTVRSRPAGEEDGGRLGEGRSPSLAAGEPVCLTRVEVEHTDGDVAGQQGDRQAARNSALGCGATKVRARDTVRMALTLTARSDAIALAKGPLPERNCA
jgi:hypothetical protein